MRTRTLTQASYLAATLMLLLTTSMQSHGSMIYEIDEGLSSFSRDIGFCVTDCSPTDEEFSISGVFEVTIEPFADIAAFIMRLSAINVETTLPADQMFAFPEYPVSLKGIEFSGNGNPCNFYPFPGTCTANGNFGGFSGFFDGTSMTFSGSAPIDERESYAFNIVARQVEVPVPGTQLLILGVLFSLSARRFVRVRRHQPESAT